MMNYSLSFTKLTMRLNEQSQIELCCFDLRQHLDSVFLLGGAGLWSFYPLCIPIH